MQVRAQQGDTIDALCWRHLGRTAGVTEQTLNLNPGIADMGPVLPIGHPVTLPDPAAAVADIRPMTQLWD